VATGAAAPGGRVQGGGKINTLKQDFDFLPSTDFKFLSQIKG
jgi:hypothetical protein